MDKEPSKNWLYTLIIVNVILLILVAFNFYQTKFVQQQKTNQQLGAFSAPYNILQNITHTSTNTASVLPTLILPRNASRRYARCTNESSGTIFFWFQNFDSNIAASTTVNMNGISVTASSSYDINPDNMWIGDVWATATASGRKVNCAEN